MSVSFYGYKFGGISLFHLPAIFQHSFQILVSEFGGLETLCGRKTSHKESTTCMSVRDIHIHCKSGPSIMGMAVNRGLSISALPHCQPHKGWPRFEMICCIHLSHSFACNAFLMAGFSAIYGFKITQI